MIFLVLSQIMNEICEHVKHSNATETYAVNSKLFSQFYFPKITVWYVCFQIFFPMNNMKRKQLTLSPVFIITKHIMYHSHEKEIAICILRLNQEQQVSLSSPHPSDNETLSISPKSWQRISSLPFAIWMPKHRSLLLWICNLLRKILFCFAF